MKIIKIEPLGWCEGVSLAFSSIKKIVKLHSKEKIYLIGWLVHNEFAMNEIQKMGVIPIKVSSKNKKNVLKKIKEKKNSVIVFSAHGTDPKVVSFAKKNFKEVYDLTCKYVSSNMENVANEINDGKRILFFGTKNHPETDAFLSLSPKVKLVVDPKKMKKSWLNKSRFIHGTTQTTSILSEVNEFKSNLRKKFPISSFTSGVCKSTTARQKNLFSCLSKIDVLVVVGDKKSNNTHSLVEIAKRNKIPTKWINSYHELKKIEFKKIKNCGLCSGASTPIADVNNVYNFLKEI